MASIARAPDGVEIAYDRTGEGPPVVLVHGFAASRIITWRNTGWYEWLERAGHTVLALDCRGHGESGKPHAREDYDERLMIADILAVMDAEGVSAAPLIGYSMGSYLAIGLMREAPARLPAAILAGVGENYFSFWAERNETIAQGLLAEDAVTVTDPVAREFRTFSEKAGNDLVALAACMRRDRISLSAAELGGLPQDVMVVRGENDPVAGRPEGLASHFAHGRAVTVPRRNHHSTVGDRIFKEAARDFLAESR
jgi:pimeloyl-ACP methyl ester carboxylesterase